MFERKPLTSKDTEGNRVNLKAVFSSHSRHKMGDMEGGRLIPGVVLPLPYSFPVFHAG